jgi:hypothetical protein
MGVIREDEEGGSGAREPGSEFSDELEVFICESSQRSGEVQLGVTTDLLQHLLHLLQAPLQIVDICLGGMPSLHHALVAQSLFSAAAAMRARDVPSLFRRKCKGRCRASRRCTFSGAYPGHHLVRKMDEIQISSVCTVTYTALMLQRQLMAKAAARDARFRRRHRSQTRDVSRRVEAAA